ncbi:MAG: ADP/ATP-dependent (S)-NAD(P)H-hydrate dehydratase, partial [bacterium]
GQSESLREFLRQVLRHLKQPKVLDADALNNLAALKGRGALLRGAVLTPHLLEMSRLCGRPVSEIQARPVESARRFARRHRCWLVLKGYRSVIAGPKGQVWINSSGGPNLATAGSGDVLTGTIAGLLAQGLKSEIAVPTAVFLHGRAGDLLAERQGDRGTLASEIARRLSEAVP